MHKLYFKSYMRLRRGQYINARNEKGIILRTIWYIKGERPVYNTLHASVEEQIAMLIHIVGHNARNRVIRVHFL